MNTKYIKLIIKEAEKAYKKGEVPVGAIIVKNGKVISKVGKIQSHRLLSFSYAGT